MSKKYLVPVSWVVQGSVALEADNPLDAMDQATGCDLDTFASTPFPIVLRVKSAPSTMCVPESV